MSWSKNDLITWEELSPQLKDYIQSFVTTETIQQLYAALNDHKDSTFSHTTREEKAKWNNFYDNIDTIKQDLVQQVQNVLSNELSNITGSLTRHVDNEDIHVTKEEKDKWNNLSDTALEGFAQTIMSKTNEAKKYADDGINNLKDSITNGNLTIPYINGIRFSIGSVQPSSPEEEKDIWINTGTNRLYYFKNGKWTSLT